MTVKAPTGVDPFAMVSELIDVGNVDTVYRDVYLQRSRTLLAGVLPVDDFRGVEQQTAELATLPLAIARALEKGEWSKVKELSERAEMLRQRVENKRQHMETGRGVYAVTDVRLDPFSPGLRPFTRLSEKELQALRTRAVEHLAALERADASWKEFYTGRSAALKALELISSRESATQAVSTDSREAARRALKSGDMRGLAKLADVLMTAVTPGKGTRAGQAPDSMSTATPEPPSSDLFTPYSDDTLKGGGDSGWRPVASSRRSSWPRSASTPGIQSSRTSREDVSKSSRCPCLPARPKPSANGSRC